MTLFLQLGFQGIALGMVYALIALGFVIMIKGSNTFNFAHGEFVAVGAYVVLALMPHLPYWLAFLGSVVVTVSLALLVESALLRRLIDKGLTTVVLATLGISIMVHAADPDGLGRRHQGIRRVRSARAPSRSATWCCR